MLDNHAFYKIAYKKHGMSARGVNWNSRNSQHIRFAVIASMLKNEYSTCSVADAGCGFGDLYFFLEEKKLLPKHYIGIDTLQHFINISQKRLKDSPYCTLTCRDILKDKLPFADWYIASGSLNILSDFDTWLFLEKMLFYSKKGIVFNILKGSRKSENFNYKTPQEMKIFAKRKNLEIELIEDYLENDMTVKITKGKQ